MLPWVHFGSIVSGEKKKKELRNGMRKIQNIQSASIKASIKVDKKLLDCLYFVLLLLCLEH